MKISCFRQPCNILTTLMRGEGGLNVVDGHIARLPNTKFKHPNVENGGKGGTRGEIREQQINSECRYKL